jgi:hypothetical protein
MHVRRGGRNGERHLRVAQPLDIHLRLLQIFQHFLAVHAELRRAECLPQQTEELQLLRQLEHFALIQRQFILRHGSRELDLLIEFAEFGAEFVE